MEYFEKSPKMSKSKIKIQTNWIFFLNGSKKYLTLTHWTKDVKTIWHTKKYRASKKICDDAARTNWQDEMMKELMEKGVNIVEA